MLASIHAIQVADQKLKEAKEEQMTHLIPAKRAADLATELLQLRGRGGSGKSRALPADELGLSKNHLIHMQLVSTHLLV